MQRKISEMSFEEFWEKCEEAVELYRLRQEEAVKREIKREKDYLGYIQEKRRPGLKQGYTYYKAKYIGKTRL